MAPITARDRVRAAMRGEVLDRRPFAVWRHFYAEEQPDRASALAHRLVEFVRRHDLDLLKYNPRAQYHGEPWGTRYRYEDEGPPTPVRYAVADPSGWRAISALPPRGGVFDEMIGGLEIARDKLPDVPLLMTIFTPLAILERLAGKERTLADLRERPAEVLAAMLAVTETFSRFAERCVDAGADGIFLATTEWARRDVLRDDEYAEFGRPYDLAILAAVEHAWCNVLHVCGPDARVLELSDYPVAAISWNTHASATPSPSAFLAEVPDRVGIGGLSDAAVAGGSTLEAEIARLPRERWIAAGGCTIPPGTPAAGIDRARELLADRTRIRTR